MAKAVKFSEYKKLFFNRSIKKKDLVQSIKNSFDDFEDLLYFIGEYRRGLKSANTLLNNALHGKNPFPKKYEDLNKCDFQFFSGQLKRELSWYAAAILDFHDELNSFLILQSEFDDSLIKGDYISARSKMQLVNTEIGVSFWGIERRFLLDEYQYGTEENWNSRKEFLRDGIDPVVQAFSNIFSVRSEKNISFYQFNNEIEKWLHAQGILNEEKLYSINEYIRFRVNFFSFSNYSEYGFFLYRESSASIIDKYLLFIKTCTHLILNDEYKEIVIELLSKIYEKIEDSTIRNLLSLNNEFINDNYKESNNYTLIIDKYTKGDYSSVIAELKKYFDLNKNGEIHFLELYVKALCELELQYEKLIDSNNIIDDIGKSMHEVLMKSELTEDSLINILNYSYLFGNTKYGYFLYNFVSTQLGWENQINYNFLYSVYSFEFNPILLTTYRDISTIDVESIPFFSNSISIKLIHSKYNLNSLSQAQRESIPNTKSMLYQGRYLLSEGKIAEAKDIYLSHLNSKNISVIAQFEIYSQLFKCYLTENEYRDAIKLFVKVNSINPYLTNQMAIQKVLKGVVDGKFKNVGEKANLIELPISFKINSNDRIRIKQSLELFLKSINCKKPSEFLEYVEDYSKVNVIYFLKNVCSTEILQLSRNFESTYLVNEERITICKYLTQFDSSNADRYKEEIAELTQRNTISKVIGRIDERKIFVNEAKLKRGIKNVQKQNVFQNETLSPLTDDAFKRYIKLHKYINGNNEYRSINTVTFNEKGEAEVGENAKNLKYDFIFYYPAFQIFSTFFLYIRDLFVYNKENGLDTYLSTKIRHGTLPNHLRSVFESFNLVTTQSNNSYVTNEYWNEILNLNENEKLFQKLLEEFSKNIDDYSKKIKDTFIQCKSEIQTENSLAEFDYSYSEQDQISLYINKFNGVQDINHFIELSFNELWNRTENILEIVRGKFNEEYRDTYLKYLSDLESNLLNNFRREQINEILTEIMTCRTEIQYKLNNISQWFRRSESSYEGEYEVKVLAQTSIEITKNIHPSYSFDVETNFQTSATIKGEYHEHFIDLLNNCLFNMIAHSHLSSEKLNAKFTISEIDRYLKLLFINKVRNSNEHTSKLEEIKQNWKRLDSNIAKEKGTGFPKVKKIIVSDLNRKFSDFQFHCENDEIQIELLFDLKDL